MGFVTRLTRLACAITLNGHRQDNGRALSLFAGRRVCRVYLVGVVTAPIEVHDVLIAQVFNQIQSFRVLTEEVLSGVSTAVELTVLKLAIADFIHALHEQTGLIALKQRIPTPTPDHLDHIPTRAAKYALEFLNNLAVTANRAIKSLQVTVHNKV